MSDICRLAQSYIGFCRRATIATRTVVTGRGVTLRVLIPKYLSGFKKKGSISNMPHFFLFPNQNIFFL